MSVWLVYTVSWDYDQHEDVMSVHGSEETALAVARKEPATDRWGTPVPEQHPTPEEWRADGDHNGWVVRRFEVQP